MKRIICYINLILLFGCIQPNSEDNIGHEEEIEYFVNGFVQKGPFIQGTEIIIRELQSDLTPTGRTFSGSIDDDSGFFSVDAKCISPFVELSANGFYFNEVSGQLSTSPIGLEAIVNLSVENSINVNLLTHLQKKRVEFLIDSGLEFDTARSQSKEEILNIFGISDVSIGHTESLDISKEGDGNAILLAISSILQGNRSEAELTEILSRINTDIRTDGILNSSITIQELANSASDLDLEIIRQNIVERYEILGLVITIPAFEGYIDSDGDGKLNNVDYDIYNQSPGNESITKDTIPDFSWGITADVNKYEFQISETKELLLNSDIISLSTNSYSPSQPLNNDQGHYWRVRSINAEEQAGVWSEIYLLNIRWGEIGSLSPNSGLTIIDTTPTLTWIAAEDAVSFEIQIADSENLLDECKEIAITSNSYTSELSLTNDQIHYWRVRAVDTDEQKGIWSDVSVFTLTSSPAIGTVGPSDGIIFYDDEADGNDDIPSFRYLEVALSDIDNKMKWGTYDLSINAAENNTVGAGNQNTLNIISDDSATDKAADVCDSYSVTFDGTIFSDWFLPSKDELNLLYEVLKVSDLGDFNNDYYWSSSQVGSECAWGQNFSNGYQDELFFKNNSRYVRAIRAFNL